MKKIIVLVVLVLVTASIGSAKEYESSYGFSISVPEHWLVLTRSEIKENPDLFDFENTDFGNMDKNLLKQVIDKIRNGNTELFINQKTSDATFSDNINIIKQAGKIPTSNKNIETQCDELKTQLAKYFGRPINLYQCEVKTVNNLKTLITEFDGAMGGTTCMQYQFQKSPSVLLIITATCKNKTVDMIRQEFNEMINSIQFK